MKSRTIRTRRFMSISVLVFLGSIAWSPVRAVAGDSPVDPLLEAVAETTSGAADLVDPVTGPVDQSVDAVSNTADTLSDPLPDPVDEVVDEVVDTTNDTVDGVSDTASGIVDPVSDATSGTVDAVAGGTTDVVGGVTDALGTNSGANLPAGASVGGKPGTSAGSSVGGRAGSASSTRAMESGPSGGAALLEAREGAVPVSDMGSTSPCVAVTPTTCETTSQAAQDSLAGRVAEIIRELLAFTGWEVLPWIAAVLVLSIVGIALVRRTGRPSLRDSASGS